MFANEEPGSTWQLSLKAVLTMVLALLQWAAVFLVAGGQGLIRAPFFLFHMCGRAIHITH